MLLLNVVLAAYNSFMIDRIIPTYQQFFQSIFWCTAHDILRVPLEIKRTTWRNSVMTLLEKPPAQLKEYHTAMNHAIPHNNTMD